ncbi:MAG: hypothetical protein D6698_12205 [Gammaproteobacteria bacterium]|nr:MAG: hypothetical protein D6698_12205 [Gammaproteobacteria bacterium]
MTSLCMQEDCLPGHRSRRGCRNRRRKVEMKKWIMTSIGMIWAGLALNMVDIHQAVAQMPSAETDDPHYQYADNKTCGTCHQEKLRDYQSSMMGKTPYDKVFRQFYAAVNAKGEPDGIGFRAFKPNGPSDCASCHTPDVVLDAGHELSLEEAIKRGSKGISCDYCHTIKDVKVIYDPDSKRYDTRLWKMVTRARGNVKRGPLKDAKSPFHGTKFSPIHTRSEFCAACHNNQEHLLSLDTYHVWKQAYDKGVVKQTCQQCHMPVGGKDRRIAIGGPVRPASQIHRHFFHGGHDADMVKKAATMKIETSNDANGLVVKVDVTNSGAGHTFPGAATLRNVLLVVDALDDNGKPLAHVGSKKELLPPLAGMGKTPRDFGGHVGAMFARPFATKTGKTPTGGFNADHVLFDTRIYPRQTAHREFHFAKSASSHGRVRVRLIYRWAFKPLVDKKGWKMDDIVIFDRKLSS